MSQRVTSAEVVRTGNFLLPRTRVVEMVLEAKATESKSSGNPMIVLETEVIAGPDGGETVTVNGQQCKIAGMKITRYLSLSDKALVQFFDLQKRLGMQEGVIKGDDGKIHAEDNQEIADEFKGKALSTLISTQPDMPQTKNEATGQYEAILGEDGKPIINGYKVATQTSDILGLSKMAAPNTTAF